MSIARASVSPLVGTDTRSQQRVSAPIFFCPFPSTMFPQNVLPYNKYARGSQDQYGYQQ